MYLVGIVTRHRYQGLDVLLNSLGPNFHPVVVVDLSDPDKFMSCKDKCTILFKNFPNKTVVYGKNALIRFFLNNTTEDYLFIIEDDIKVLDNDVFNRYIDVSNKYSIPHMNFNRPVEEAGEVVYNFNKDVKVSERVHGCFQFFTRRCLEKVGLMNTNLCHNCWEHIEHTARIHRAFRYQPNFWHFPDLIDSNEYLKHQRIPSIINTPKSIYDTDKIKMFNSLGWKSLPAVDIKRLKILGE